MKFPPLEEELPGKFWKTHPADAIFWVFFVALIALVLVIFRDYGYSWDEIEHHRRYGMAVLRFYETLGGDLSSTNTGNLHLYGGAFDSIAELVVRFTPFEPRNARHLANALAGLLGILGTRLLGRRAGGPWAGLTAAFFLALTPSYFGHMFINAKDIPFAAGAVWSLYFLDKSLGSLPRPPMRDRIMLALSLGLMLGVRVGGALTVFYGVVLIFWEAIEFSLKNGGVKAFFSRLRMVSRSLVPVLVSSYAIMLFFWPAALLKPVAKPLEALFSSGRFEWTASVLWNGRWFLSKELPLNYLPVVFGVELPPLLVVLLPFAFIWALYSLIRALKSADGEKARRLALLLMAAILPPFIAVAGRATLYDNMRHFLFILPPLYCLAGWAAAEFSSRLAAWRTWSGFAPAAVALPLFWVTAIQTADLHPYEYTYKNEFGGGIPKAAERFDTDYWLTSYREAALMVISHAQKACEAGGLDFSSVAFSVAVTGPVEMARETLPSQFNILPNSSAGKTDYLITTTRWGMDRRNAELPEVGTVSRSGMTFAVVRTTKALYEKVKGLE